MSEPTNNNLSQEEIDRLQRISNAQVKKTCGTGSKVAAYIFFGITVAVFAFYLFLSITILYAPLLNSPENLGEAIGETFAYLFGLILTFGFAILQLPENIVSIILFSRLTGRTYKKGERAVYIVFLVLSILMLVITVLSLGIFLGVALKNH